MSSHRQGFWRKQRKKSPIAWLCAVGAAPFGWGAIRTGDALPTNGDNDTGTGSPSRDSKQKSTLRPRKLWGGSLSCPKEAVENRQTSVALQPSPKGYVVRSSAAKDRFRNRERPLSVGRGNGSSCPTAVIAQTHTPDLSGCGKRTFGDAAPAC
jgi:hypothetical protein